MKTNRGFTLIELLLSLTISSIIIICLSSILNFTINSCRIGEMEDEVLLNGRYAMEYIKKEIKSADKIISIEKFDDLDERYEDNFDFVIMKHDPNGIYEYNYSTYYLKNNVIYRIASNINKDKLPKGVSFQGHNEIAEYIISIEGTGIDFDTKLINLSFTLKGKKEFKSDSKIGIQCPVIH